MKTNLKLFGSSLAICVAMIACENKYQDVMSKMLTLKVQTMA